tara:strand:- start:2604 stop:3083 length:480 start_codon:yes stop_codon:yes gene_type:complete
MSQKDTFKKHGGYFIDGIAYMDCKESGEPVANVSLNSVSVTSSRVLNKKCVALLSETERNRLFGIGASRSSGSVRPRGWKWMKEFVDASGNVYHKGVEQPKLKGKRPVTDVAAIKKKQIDNKEKRRKAENKKLLKMAAEKKAIKKAIDKQKDFLNKHAK